MRVGMSVEKTTYFRGVQQPFANVYHFQCDALGPDQTAALTRLLNAVVAQEKQFHATEVAFVRGRVWSTGISQAANEMLVDQALTGQGARIAQATFDRERAYLLQWPAGKNSRGKPVYLRKWYHTLNGSTTTQPSDGMLANKDPVLANIATYLEGEADYFTQILDPQQPAGTDNWGLAVLCAQSGRQTTGPPKCHPYLEHHQLGDQWRG